MRRGYDSQLVFSESGQMVAFATGSDACSEHEGGSEMMQAILTEKKTSEAEVLQALRKQAQPTGFLRTMLRGLFTRLRSGKPVKYPDLLDSKRIVKFPKELQFIVKHEGEAHEAILGLAQHDLSEYADHNLCFHKNMSQSDPNVAGAWDDRSFAIRVRGKEYVDALTAFHEALRAGKVGFAGTFLKREPRLGGVILADLTQLSEEDKAAIRSAQADMESKLRLKARSEEDALYKEIRQHTQRHIGHLWPMWSDEQETEVVYGLNPNSGIPAAYYGPYRKEQLLEWARENCRYYLRPNTPKGAETSAAG